MLNIQLTFLFAFLTLLSLVSAHSHVVSWTINGEEKAGFDPTTPGALGPTAQRPTTNNDEGPADYTAGIVACGGIKAPADLQTWDVDPGSTVIAHWQRWPQGQDHLGPIDEYMAKCPGTTCNGVIADTLDWFKIAQATYSAGKWPTELLAETLQWSFKIPADLAPGAYLVRHSLMAMHSSPPKPQIYPVCFQANLKGSGSAVPSDTAKFPAAYDINPQFKTYSLWDGKVAPADFVPPGPAVYGGGGDTGPVAKPSVLERPTSAGVVATTAVGQVTSSAAGVPSLSSTVIKVDPTTVLAPATTWLPAAVATAVKKPCTRRRKRDFNERFAIL